MDGNDCGNVNKLGVAKLQLAFSIMFPNMVFERVFRQIFVET